MIHIQKHPVERSHYKHIFNLYPIFWLVLVVSHCFMPCPAHLAAPEKPRRRRSCLPALVEAASLWNLGILRGDSIDEKSPLIDGYHRVPVFSPPFHQTGAQRPRFHRAIEGDEIFMIFMAPCFTRMMGRPVRSRENFPR
jgi:hypothetical protein